MKLQELYDTMYIGLASQNWKQSKDLNQWAAYRGTEDRKCAVGYLLTDEEAKGLPNVKIYSLGDRLPERLHIFKVFLRDAQDAHDTANNAEDMKDKFEDLAENYNLTVPETKG